jgi:hypothetical protein
MIDELAPPLTKRDARKFIRWVKEQGWDDARMVAVCKLILDAAVALEENRERKAKKQKSN